MNVQELITALSKCDPNATVLGYDSGEECSFEVCTVELETKEKHHYCKSDHILDYKKFDNGTVTLSNTWFAPPEYRDESPTIVFSTIDGVQ